MLVLYTYIRTGSGSLTAFALQPSGSEIALTWQKTSLTTRSLMLLKKRPASAAGAASPPVPAAPARARA